MAVGRSNRLLTEAYLETKDGADAGKYRPKVEFIKGKIAFDLTINS